MDRFRDTRQQALVARVGWAYPNQRNAVIKAGLKLQDILSEATSTNACDIKASC